MCWRWLEDATYAESQMNRATDARSSARIDFQTIRLCGCTGRWDVAGANVHGCATRIHLRPNKTYRPANYGGGYSMKEVPMRTGFVKSLNVVTVDVALQTGLARIANLAERFGLPKPERYPSLALGTEEVTPLQIGCGLRGVCE